MPVLCKKSSDLASTQAGYEEDTQLQTTVCHWLTQPLAGEPLVALQAGPTNQVHVPSHAIFSFLTSCCVDDYNFLRLSLNISTHP
jgi:hypothetical protein